MERKLAVSMFGQKRLSREGGIEIVAKELCTRMVQNGCTVTCYNRSGHHVSGAEYDNKTEYALKRGTFMFVKLHFVKDYEVRKVLWQEKAASKIKPYLRYKETEVQGLKFSDKTLENPIWIYWNKGIDSAPEIVKKCYESVCKYAKQEVVLLNDQNLADYIQLPDYIEQKKTAGQIPMAGYADLMRFALLEHYGGTWIDATVYLTNFIPTAITESDFFAVRNSLLLIDNPVLYPAWFLHPHKLIELLWCILLIVLPVALVFSDSSMANIQSISIISAFPIGIIMIIMIAGFLRDIKKYIEEKI